MLGNQENKVLGIDGCKTGWCVAVYDGINYSIEIFSTRNQILHQHSDAICCLIDMPIGLPRNGEKRNQESIARKELSPGFSSTIFTPPCYEALSATNYEEAKLINQQITGKIFIDSVLELSAQNKRT
jgi:predicted RNase H-like nuclease